MSYGKILFLFLFSAISFGAFAQNSTVISGYVKDGNEIITGASIMVKGTKTVVTSDGRGYYEIANIKPGAYTIVVSYLGYLKESKSVTLSNDQKLNLSFSLKKDQQQLHNVNIHGKTKNQEVKESGFAVNAIDTKKFANTTADLNQILNRSTGVRIREQGGLGSDFNFSINGLSGKQVKFFIDGVPMDVMGSAMALNNIPVNLADRLEVYKGVVPVQLGADAMGGAVNVVTNQKANNYLDLSHSYGSFNTNRSALIGQYVDKKTGITVKGSGFFNYSDNNYTMKNVDVVVGGSREGDQITDLNGATFEKGNVKRFHDNYKSTMGQLEVGVTNKKWADVLFAGVGFNEAYQDLQTGFEQSIVYGQVRRNSRASSATLRYKKENLFTEGLSVTAFVARSKDSYKTIDTMLRQYNLDGSWFDKAYSEMGGIKAISNIKRPRTYALANVSYTITPQHSVSLNYTIDHLKNEIYNELLVPRDSVASKMNKQIVGFSYQQDLLDKRLVNTFFAKYYRLDLQKPRIMNKVTSLSDTTFNNYGYGFASRYMLIKGLGIKASYEHAYRLQEAEEMFGDGLNLQPNLSLRPEKSDNINLGAFYNFQINKHAFYVEASGFYRNAKDFIYARPDIHTNLLQNLNLSSLRITGFESEVRYAYDQLLALNLNVTYQNAINTVKFGQTESTIYEGTYGDALPNRPFLFGNADFTIGKNDVVGKDTRMQLNWYTQYVNWFYLTWGNNGHSSGKSTVDTQFIHNVAFTYSLQNNRYNFALECKNITDVLAYDNFALQKPGRSFSLKFRYFIQ